MDWWQITEALALDTKKVGSMGVSLKTNGKHCSFVAVSDVLWTQPKSDKRNHSKCHLLAVTNKRVNYLLASFLTAMSVSDCPHYHTYVLLQLCLADVREAEGEQRLPRSHVQHVVLLAEQQRGVVKDAVHGEPLGRPLLCIWKTRGKCTRDYYRVAGHRKEEQSGADHYSS